MTDKKVWFITGAGRGMGTDIAKAALAAGHAVVATGRNAERSPPPSGQDENLLAVQLDVTDPADASAAVQAAVERFGRIECWSTTPATSTPGSSRSSAPQDVRPRSRRTCSAR